jgi:hypothetical protein
VEVVEPLGSGDLESARQRAAATLDDVLSGLDVLLA